ncbi:response regulator transcription factor [Oceanobacillus manasiensis]|uniref:response regulator transcription factor n=1 Tax=Oceanobacillus manasiensis TaxID=586413 RepID=UPI0006941C20|nr:response regulator transcription factor [Oceanobacillus manasiensis]
MMVIDDEQQMRQMIRTFLERDGYTVLEATDGTHALSLLEKNKPHLLIVDVMMPFMDGFTFAKELKPASDLPLIFLSAKGEEWDKIHGLKLGGDDYITKPFLPEELLARVESVLRRAYRHKTSSDILTAGPIVLNNISHLVTLEGSSLSLTRKEFSVLQILLKNTGRVYSREQLLHLVWKESQQSSERTVDTHIKTLRLKMGHHGHLIKTVWGVGYKFEVENEEAFI